MQCLRRRRTTNLPVKANRAQDRRVHISERRSLNFGHLPDLESVVAIWSGLEHGEQVGL